jgi:hypothetical protein
MLRPQLLQRNLRRMGSLACSDYSAAAAALAVAA